MRNDRLSESGRHARHFDRPDHPAKIVVVRLYHIDPFVGQQPPETVETVVLLAVGNRDAQSLGQLANLLEMVKHDRLLKVGEPVFFKQSSDP